MYLLNIQPDSVCNKVLKPKKQLFLSKICVSINFRLIGLIRKKTDTPPTGGGTVGMRGHKITCRLPQS